MGVERAGEQPRPGAGGRPGVGRNTEGGDRLLVVGQARQQPPARQHVPHPAPASRGFKKQIPTRIRSQGQQIPFWWLARRASSRPPASMSHTLRQPVGGLAADPNQGLQPGSTTTLLVVGQARQQLPARQHVPHPAGQQAHPSEVVSQVPGFTARVHKRWVPAAAGAAGVAGSAGLWSSRLRGSLQGVEGEGC